MASPLSYIGRGLRGLWWLLDTSRRALLNGLLLVLIVAIVWGLLRGGAPTLQPKTALVLDISGRIVEQRAGSARDNAFKRVQGQSGDDQTRLRDLLAVLDAAAKDDNISHAVLVLDNFRGAGLPSLREVAAGLTRFKASGKPVIAWGSQYDQRGYYLAAHATEVWLHPMGDISVQGYGGYRSYYKDLFDRVGVTAHVIRAGQFKSFSEPYAANAPSPQTLEADGALYGALWATWTADVEKARKQPAGSVMKAIDSLPESAVALGGDAAQWALQGKWVDALKTRDELRTLMIERGARDDKTFRQIGWADYLRRVDPNARATTTDAVGVIVAEGSIGDGQAGPGSIGGLSTSEMIRAAREDNKVKALVLRVNSPGGSAFGSELVRRELELTRKAGKPVVVSMGDVAASGGYWIATAADEVIADAATITGSIGVISMLPTAEGAFDKLGIHTGGVTTTWLGGAYDVRRGIDPRFVTLVQASIDHVYREFTARVAAARKTTPEKIDAVAQGRVWAGKDALANGLVDRLGSFTDAVKTAAVRAKLADGYRVEYVEAQPGRLDRLLEGLGVTLPVLVGPSAELQGTLLALGLATSATPAMTQMAEDLAGLAAMGASRKPFSVVAHCLCSAP